MSLRNSVMTTERPLKDQAIRGNANTTARPELTLNKPNAVHPIHSKCTVNANVTILPNDLQPMELDVNRNVPTQTKNTPMAYAVNRT